MSPYGLLALQQPPLINNHVLVCLIAQLCLTLCDPKDCSPWVSSVCGDSPGKNIGGGCRALLQGISPTQGSNPGILHLRWIFDHLSHQGSPLVATLPCVYSMVFIRYPTSRTTLNRLSPSYVEHSSSFLCPLKAFSPFVFWHRYSCLGTFLNS